MSLKRPQLSFSPRFIPTKHSTLTRHISSLCVLNRLPFTCWSATCQFGHLKCLQASVIFFSTPFVQGWAEYSQPEGFKHRYATGRYSSEGAISCPSVGNSYHKLPLSSHLCPTLLSLLLQ